MVNYPPIMPSSEDPRLFRVHNRNGTACLLATTHSNVVRYNDDLFPYLVPYRDQLSCPRCTILAVEAIDENELHVVISFLHSWTTTNPLVYVTSCGVDTPVGPLMDAFWIYNAAPDKHIFDLSLLPSLHLMYVHVAHTNRTHGTVNHPFSRACDVSAEYMSQHFKITEKGNAVPGACDVCTKGTQAVLYQEFGAFAAYDKELQSLLKYSSLRGDADQPLPELQEMHVCVDRLRWC